MRNTTLLLMIAAALAIPGCKKDADAVANNAADTTSGMLGQAAAKAKVEQAAAALPQPDANMPLSNYRNMDKNSTDSIFLYQTASSMPPDFEKLAAKFSREYRETSDSFRKQELLAALKPQMEQLLLQFKSSPYAYVTLKYTNNLEAYDFQRKGFPVFLFGENVRQEDIGEYPNTYNLNWANKSQVAFAPVAEESVAREIEGMRTRQKYENPPMVKVYFFAQSANLNSDEIDAYVTRVQIIDKSGRVLAEYGPDGSISAEANTETEDGCGGDPAACAAAAVGY